MALPSSGGRLTGSSEQARIARVLCVETRGETSDPGRRQGSKTSMRPGRAQDLRSRAALEGSEASPESQAPPAPAARLAGLVQQALRAIPEFRGRGARPASRARSVSEVLQVTRRARFHGDARRYGIDRALRVQRGSRERPVLPVPRASKARPERADRPEPPARPARPAHGVATGATGATGLTGATGSNGTTGAQGTIRQRPAPREQQARQERRARPALAARPEPRALRAKTVRTGRTARPARQGPTGARGPTGTQGPTGSTGAQGPTGVRGPTGAQGPSGSTGATGAQGPTGGTGATGAQGPPGPGGTAGTVADSVAATAATPSLTYADLTTVGPTVTLPIPVSGRVLVSVTSGMTGSSGAVSVASCRSRAPAPTTLPLSTPMQ